MEMIFELVYEEDGLFGKDSGNDLEVLLAECKNKIENPDLELITKGFNFCLEGHKDITRQSGTPYYTHPLNVAIILLREFPIYDVKSVIACLLHDTIEDVEQIEESTISKEFGEEIAEIVSAVTKISHEETSKLQNKASTYRKLFLSLVRDVRVILIKLADRLHNMRTLHYLSPQKQKEIALETLNFYTPLAHRLGLSKIKMELENRSFYYSDRSTYEAIRTELNEKRRDFIDYIKVFSDHIQNSLRKHGIEHSLTIVHKHEYEIYQMIQEGKALSDIDNFYSMVIVLATNDVTECYKAHGVLANAFNAIGFVDYIVNPKMDWYKALNCELYGPDGKRVELLIRTQEMEKIAEEGFANAFSLKTGRNRALKFNDEELDNWGAWMQGIIEDKGGEASRIIWNSIKVNLFDSELVVYSKSGEAVKMPDGASIIDYAFAVSPEAGLHLISAKVNGLFKDLSYVLQTGDQVEIMTSPNVFPRLEWQKSAITHRAVVQLYFFFKHNPAKEAEDADEVYDYDIKLYIKGEDKEGMLNDLTSAIGLTRIKRINLDTSGTLFEGAITLNIHSKKHLNQLFRKLFSIPGVKAVKKVDLG